MKAPPAKCALPECARDAAKAARGGNARGRPPEGSPHLPRYCRSHYEQIRRGQPVGSLRAYGTSQRTKAIEDCATIADFHGHPDLAALFRSLKSRGNARQTSKNGSDSNDRKNSAHGDVSADNAP